MKARKRILATLCMAAMMLSMFTQGLMPMTAYAGSTAITFTKAGGGSESIYAEVTGVTASDILGVSWTGTSSGALTTTDIQYLVRDKGDYVRIDIPGIKPGTYKLSVATEDRVAASQDLSVKAYDRSGFAHFNYTGGVGAYKDDGTLKENAIVLYVTDENKNSVQLSYGGKTVTGIGNILNSVGQESPSTPGFASNGGAANTNQGIIKDLALAGKPLVVRFLGTVTDSGLRTRGAFDASKPCLINGLTAYDSVDQGGTAGDNGHMARIQSGKDITLEGVGSDAVIDGWGFHFIAQSSNPELGKSFEVRNLTFINTAEDAVGMEGQQASKNASSDLTASVERCWIHNNEFFCPEISNPAESDKGEGDGSVDFKRGQYFTCSYNYFEGCHKTNLVGSADYSLQFNLTYHHNYWFMCSARGPLTRRANVHMYNNVFEMQTDYAMNTRADAYIFSEYNLFYACKSPHAVEAGAIKSFNDSLASPLYKKGSPATVVSDRSEIVPNNCAFSARNIDYSRFDTDSALSYIPGGNYDLQTDLTELRKVIAARTGVMGNPVKDPDDIVPGDYSLITRSGTNVEQIALPYEKTYSATEGKFSKKCYAFEVTAPAEVTVSYGTNPGVLVNDAGEMLLEGSGSVANLPAGKYMIQAAVIQPGSYAKGDRFVTWKEFNLVSLSVKATDPDKHYHTLVLASDECVSASCTAAGKNVYKCSDPNCDDPSYRKVDTLPALGHAWGDWTVTKEATQTEAGSKTRKCGRCDATETEEIPAGSGGETGNVYTITLDYNYDDAPDDIVMEEIPENRVYNSVDGLIPDGFGRTGYTLNGFYSDPDCWEQVSFPYTVTSSATLYAGWTENDAPVSHYLIFDANGGSDVPTAVLPSSGSYEITQTSTRKGYRFEGWFDSPAGGEKVTALSISSVTDNVTVYAHWEKDESVDESFVAASFLNDINALSDYEKYGHILNYKDEQGQTVKGSAYKAGTNGNDDNPLIYGPFTFTDWKIPSKQKDTIAALYEGTTSGTLKVEAPAASLLTIKGRTTDGDNANYNLTGPDGRAYLPEESGKTNKFSGNTIETRTYKLGMAGVYTLAYDREKQTSEGESAGEVRFAEVNLKGVSDESADPWHIVKFVQKSEAESGTDREISLIKKAHGDFLDEDDFPSPSLDAGDVFTGWYPENGTPEGALKPEEIAGERVMNDMTYYAAIEKTGSVDTYTVSYSISGNVLYRETVNAGETLSDIPSVSAPAGAEFKGWSETENGTLIDTGTWKPAGDDTLYAVFANDATIPQIFSGEYYVYDAVSFGIEFGFKSFYYSAVGAVPQSCDMFKSTGSKINSKQGYPAVSGESPVDGKTYVSKTTGTAGIKLESSTAIGYTIPDGKTYTLYLLVPADDNGYSAATVKVDDVARTPVNGVIKVEGQGAGDHTIKRGSGEGCVMAIYLASGTFEDASLKNLTCAGSHVEHSIVPGKYYKGTTIRFSAKPAAGYKDLRVSKEDGFFNEVLSPDEDGLYSVKVDGDIRIVLSATADTVTKSGISTSYEGASSTMIPGTYDVNDHIDFAVRLNPGYKDISVKALKEDGADRTVESIVKNPDGSYYFIVQSYDLILRVTGTRIDPTGLAITNGEQAVAAYPGSAEGAVEAVAGTPLTLNTEVTPAEAVCDVLWTSGDEKIAKVSRGRIIPIAAGETVITAKADGYEKVGVSITLKVKEPQPESASIKLNGSVVSEDQPLDLKRGEIVTLSPSVAPAGVNYTASWESGTPSVATVDNGTITAVGPGESVITLTVKGAGADAVTLTAKAKVVVTDIVPTGLSLKDPDGKNLTGDSIVPLKTGNKFLVTAEIKPADATVGTVTYSSGSPLTAKVDPSTGEVTALLPGTATITAALTWTSGSDQGRIESSFKVVVSLLPDPEVEPESFTIMDPAGNELTAGTVVPMKVGDKLNVSSKIQPEGAIGAVTYASSAPGTASVKLLTGEVEALKAGTSTITATLSWLVGGAEKTLTQSFSVSITEQGQPEVIPTDLILKDSKGQTLSADSLVELKVGDKFPVTAERKPEGAIGTVTFESDKPSVAAVGQTTGEVTAVSAGTAQITARLVWSTAGQSQTGQMESHFKVEVTSSGPEPTPGAEDVEMLPGEVKRLNLFENHYTYPVRWTLESADPKGCVTLKNGVVTAKPLKKGTTKAEAVVKAAYNGGIYTYNIKIDCDVPAAKAIPNGKKMIELKAPKKLNLNVGDAKKKSVTVKIPAELREGVTEDSIGCEMTVDDVCEIGKPVFDDKKTKATFEVDPVDAGATYIIWSMTRGEEKTVAVTEVIVKKPRQENDFTIEQTMYLSVGEIGMLLVEDTANNTDPKDLSFSVKGKGIKVSKSGAVAAVVPGSSGTVTVKAGKIKREVRVTVSGDHASDYLMLNKALLSVKPGTKGKTVSLTLKRVVTPKKKVELPGISEIQVQGDISDQGIKGEADKSKPGKINVTVPAGTLPGTYLIVVEPEDTELNPVCCELIVK